MSRLRHNSGFTLVEVLVSIPIMVVVLLATLTVFDRFNSNASTARKQNDALDVSRVTIDQITKQLRNLANPTTGSSTIGSAADYSFAFQTSDPSRTWVRYCLQGGTAATGGTVWLATADSTTTAVTPAMVDPSSCPGTGWKATKVVATDIVNRLNGLDRPLFSYTCVGSPPPSGCPAGSADYPKIISARADLYVDVNPGKVPAERRVSSGVYLRNQNEAPTAAFTAASQAGTPRTVVLNASASEDPEGRTLQYYWFKGAGSESPVPGDACGGGTTGGAAFIGQGVVFTYKFPVSDPSPQTLRLVVKDPGCLQATASKVVAIP